MPLKPEESKTKKILFTAVIGFVLLSSIIGFTYSAIPILPSAQQGNLKFNGIEFFPTATGVAADIDGQFVEFTYYPNELGNLDTAGAVSRITSSRMVYVTSDPNSTLAGDFSGLEYDIGRALERNHNTFIEVAFTANNPFGKRIITCDDANAFVPVVFFNSTNGTTAITLENNCIIVNVGSENGFNRVHDKLIYELLGIEP